MFVGIRKAKSTPKTLESSLALALVFSFMFTEYQVHGAIIGDGSVDSTFEINSSTPNGPALSDSDYFGSSVASLEILTRMG